MTIPDWYIDELAFAGPEHLEADYVAGYDRKAGTDPAEDLALLRERGLDETQTVVDLGAGTGTFALAAAPVVHRVVAVDVSRPMLGALEDKLTRAGQHNVELVHAGFLSYEHTGGPADVVYTRHALHHLPDFWKVIALRRIARILRPGGTLFLRDLVFGVEPAEVEEAIEVWLGRATNDSEVGWTREELATHVREEYSTFSWLLEPMLERAGFAIEVAEQHGPTYTTYICTRR